MTTVKISAQLKVIQARTLATCLQDQNEYGGAALPDYTQSSLQGIRSCKTVVEAEQLAKKTVERNQVHFLAAWANGRIRGKVTTLRLEREIQEAEKLADFLDKKELQGQADQQRQRAVRLREELKAMKAVR